MVVVSVVASSLFALATVEAWASSSVGSPPAEAPAPPPTTNLSKDRLFMVPHLLLYYSLFLRIFADHPDRFGVEGLLPYRGGCKLHRVSVKRFIGER